MNIIIVGAGRIGEGVAEALVSESNDITVIDSNPDRIADLEHFDLQAVLGDATSPKLLADIGAREADMIICVTASDEVNMVVSLYAAQLFNIPLRIARVRKRELRQYPRLLAEEGFGITSTIWPEESITKSLFRLIEFPEVLQIVDFADGKASLIALCATVGSPMIGRAVSELPVHLPEVPSRIVSITRRNRQLDVTGDTVIESGDEVIVLAQTRDIRRVAREFSTKEQRTRKIIIGGNLELAMQLVETINTQEQIKNFNIKIIANAEEAEKLRKEELPVSCDVYEGSINDDQMLIQAGIDICDLFIALSDDDENNILGSLLAKKLGAPRVISMINNKTYQGLMQGSQIDITLSIRQSTIGELLPYIRRGDVVAAHSLRHGVAEALEVVAHGTKKSSRVVGRTLKEVAWPNGVSVGAIVRDAPDGNSELIVAKPDIVVEPDDHLIIFVPSTKLIPKIEALFSVEVGFF